MKMGIDMTAIWKVFVFSFCPSQIEQHCKFVNMIPVQNNAMCKTMQNSQFYNICTFIDFAFCKMHRFLYYIFLEIKNCINSILHYFAICSWSVGRSVGLLVGWSVFIRIEQTIQNGVKTLRKNCQKLGLSQYTGRVVQIPNF